MEASYFYFLNISNIFLFIIFSHLTYGCCTQDSTVHYRRAPGTCAGEEYKQNHVLAQRNSLPKSSSDKVKDTSNITVNAQILVIQMFSLFLNWKNNTISIVLTH